MTSVSPSVSVNGRVWIWVIQGPMMLRSVAGAIEQVTGSLVVASLGGGGEMELTSWTRRAEATHGEYVGMASLDYEDSKAIKRLCRATLDENNEKVKAYYELTRRRDHGSGSEQTALTTLTSLKEWLSKAEYEGESTNGVECRRLEQVSFLGGGGVN
jgi:hypothetical protein